MFKVLAHGEIVDLRVVFFLVVGHIMARGDIRLDDVDLIKRRQDQQLQVKLLEEFHCIACVHLIRPDERLVDYDKAESYLFLAIDKNPKFYEAYFNLGVTYQKQNRIKDAIDVFTLFIDNRIYEINGNGKYGQRR